MRKDGKMFLAGKSATEGRTSDDTLPNPDNAKLRSSEHIKICIGEHCDEDRLLILSHDHRLSTINPPY